MQKEFFPRALRAAWPAEFPDVVIHASETAVKQHPAYTAAKAGDVEAAAQLVMDSISDEALDV